LTGSTIAGVATYTGQVGRYVRNGDVVTFSIYLAWSAHTGTGNILINGLPFTSNNTALSFTPVITRSSGITMTAGNYMGAYISTSTTSITLEQYPTGGGNPVAIPMDTVGSIMFNGSYIL